MSRSISRARFLILALVAAAGAATPVHAQNIDTLALRAHTFFLASDLLAGRGTGSPGELLAAEYIESQLRMLGLRGIMPGGGYRQSVPLRSLRVDEATTLLTVAGGSAPRRFATGRDFVLGTGGPAAFRDFDGPAVLVGDAARAPADGADLGDRVVVVFGTLGADAARLVPAWERAGVAGVLQLVPDTAQFALLARSRGTERLYVDADVADPIWQPSIPTVIAGPDLAAALLAGFEPPAASLREPFDPLPLGRHVNVSIRGQTTAIDAANIGGVLPGNDPARRDELVVFTAHYDHIGIVPALSGGDSIYNGFSDNAAGVAMLLAIARALRASPPARSVAFLFLTGEERGLLGSSFFAARPPFPLDRVTAVINLDAGAPPAPPVAWRIAGGSDSPLGGLAADVAARHGWTAQLSPASPNSDYWPFLRRGVPAIFLIPGAEWEGTSPPERDALRQRWDRYHHPDDEWAPDFPFAGLRRYAAFALLVARAAADAPRRP